MTVNTITALSCGIDGSLVTWNTDTELNVSKFPVQFLSSGSGAGIADITFTHCTLGQMTSDAENGCVVVEATNSSVGNALVFYNYSLFAAMPEDK